MLCWRGLYLLSPAVIPVMRLQIFVLVLYSECSIIQQLSSPLYHFAYCSLPSAFVLIKNKSPTNMANTHISLYVYCSLWTWSEIRIDHTKPETCCVSIDVHTRRSRHYQINHTNRFFLCGLIMYCTTSLSPIYTNTSGRYSCHILNLKLL